MMEMAQVFIGIVDTSDLEVQMFFCCLMLSYIHIP